MPKSPLRGNRRAGGHNSLTRTRLKPNLMVGGYGQFTYHFNYWGPIGCNRDTHIYVRKLPEADLVTQGKRRYEHGRADPRFRWSSTWTSVSVATPAASPARTSGPTARAPSTCGGTTWRPSRAPAIPCKWEDQDKYRGGWEKKERQARILEIDRQGAIVANIFHNPSMPSLDDYYEPWTYDYQNLFNAPEGDDQPTARPISMVDGRAHRHQGRPQLGR